MATERRKQDTRREPARDTGLVAENRNPGRKRKRSTRSRPLFKRIAYWGVVVGLWGVIAVGGVFALVAANLPPIQSIEIPKRPPGIEIVGLDGKTLATRGEMHGATVTLKDLPAYLPRAFIAIEDRRFYSHFGIDPIGLLRARGRQRAASRRRRRAARPSPSSSPKTCS